MYTRLSWILSNGLVAIWAVGICLWATFRLFFSLPEANVRSVAFDVAAGRSFKPDVLASLEPVMQRADSAIFPNAEVIRSSAVIRLRNAEVDLGAGVTPGRSVAFAVALSAVRGAVASMPTDSFLWFALSWLEKNGAGFTPLVADSLAMSYRTGPYEGWIAVHRNGFSISLLGALPRELRSSAFSEFGALVDSMYVSDAASVLTGPGWSVHDELLTSVQSRSEAARSQLYKKLGDLGFDLHPSGVSRNSARPWE